MADFKDELSPDLVRRLSREITGAWAGFDQARFVRLASDGLDALELKARMDWIARALSATMPVSAEEADRVLRGVLGNGGLHGWASMPVNAYVSVSMLDRPDVALPLLAVLTPQYTAEFAIRPFIEAHYNLTMEYLRAWTTDPNEHVRRLVSEGTRPRLPWAGQLSCFIADPTATLALLDALVNDESSYVRRSVANHLNDISKDHPNRALTTAARWAGESTHGDFVVRHGLRTLIKRGHPEALAILGFDYEAPVEIAGLTCTPSSITIGEAVTIAFTLRAPHETKAAIDYVVHYQGVRGPKAGKVFKMTVKDLPAGTPLRLERRHRFETVSIRTIYPGPHRIDVQVNGRVLGSAEIDIASG